MVYREMFNLRKDVMTNILVLSDNFSDNCEKMSTRLNNNMSNCITKIKTLNSNNIQQMKKINMINNQPIVNNHFTESDDSDVKTEINYLSDTHGNKSIATDNKKLIFCNSESLQNKLENKVENKVDNSNYYRSETDNANKSEKSSMYKSKSKSNCSSKIVDQISVDKYKKNDQEYEYSVDFPIYGSDNDKIIETDTISYHEKSDHLSNNPSQYNNDTVDNYLEDSHDIRDNGNKFISTFNNKDLRDSFTEYKSNNSIDKVNIINKLDTDNEFSECINDVAKLKSSIETNNENNDVNDVVDTDDDINTDTDDDINTDTDDDTDDTDDADDDVNIDTDDDVNTDTDDDVNTDTDDDVNTDTDDVAEDAVEGTNTLHIKNVVVDISHEDECTHIKFDANDIVDSKKCKILENIEPEIVNNLEYSSMSDNIINTPSDSVSSQNNNDIVITEIKNDISNNTKPVKSNKSLSVINTNIVDSDTNESDSENDITKYLESEYTGKITLGNKVGTKLIKDTDSVWTEDSGIKNMSVTDLNKINNYNVNALRKIARNLNLSISCKINGKWKQYNKTELYENIKNYLTKSSTTN